MDSSIVSAVLGSAMELGLFWLLAKKPQPGSSIEFTTTDAVQAQLEQAGFREISVNSVPHTDNLPWNVDWTVLKSRKLYNP